MQRVVLTIILYHKSGYIYWASKNVYMVFYVIMWLIENTRMR